MCPQDLVVGPDLHQVFRLPAENAEAKMKQPDNAEREKGILTSSKSKSSWKRLSFPLEMSFLKKITQVDGQTASSTPTINETVNFVSRWAGVTIVSAEANDTLLE